MNDLEDEVSDDLSNRVKRVSSVFKVARVSFVLVGGLLAGAFGVLSGGLTWPLTVFQVLAVVGALLAFFGGLLGAFIEEDPILIIDKARRERMQMERFEKIASQRQEKLQKYDTAQKQLKNLYIMYSICRGTIEQALSYEEIDTVNLIERCLEDCRHNLRIALGFQMEDFWTVCVYKAISGEETGAKDVLRCVAHQRSVECSKDDARKWPYGVGIGGIAWAKNDEVVEPDLTAAVPGSAFDTPKNMSKKTDPEHYKSMFAVPISVFNHSTCWGVVVATSSRRRHFGAIDGYGVAPEETVRSLAGIVALAVAVCEGSE